jgi:hypothetical protein
LRITLDSFFKYNTYDVAEFIIYDDSEFTIPQDLKDDYPFIVCIDEQKPIGQIEALDFLWSKVKTDYAFQMEDDWEFLREGFIEKSMAILKDNPYILQVWLQPLETNNQHPVTWSNEYGTFKLSHDLWAWHRFNPSLKRKSNYDLIAPFSKHTTFNKNKGWKSEEAISKVYNDLGFTAAILPDRYIKHIGEDRRCV